MILHTPFGLIWTTPWPDGKELFLKISKIRNSRNSQNSVWKPKFFLGALYQKLFALQAHYTGDTPYRVWFDLDNSLTRRKKPIFKRPAQPFFCFTLSLHCWYSIPSLVWFGQLLDPLEKKLKFSKFRNSRNSQNSVWKPNFFLGALYQKLFALQAHYTGDTPYRVWFDLDNSLTRRKKPIFRRPAQPFFLLYTLITLVILHTAFGLIWTTP